MRKTDGNPIPANPAGQWRPGTGIVAHESAHNEALSLLEEAMPVAAHCRLVVSPGLGMLCGGRLELPVRLTAAGVQQSALDVADLVSRGRIDAVVYLPNPLANPRWDAALQTLVRRCNPNDVPLATNAATARAVLAEVGVRMRSGFDLEKAREIGKEEALDDRRTGDTGLAEAAPQRLDENQDAHTRVAAPDAGDGESRAAVFPLRGELGLD